MNILRQALPCHNLVFNQGPNKQENMFLAGNENNLNTRHLKKYWKT